MAKLYARFGTMGSSKSANLLMVAKNYELQNKKVLVFTSHIDNRSGEYGMIASRTGMSRKATTIFPFTDVFDEVKLKSKYTDIHCVLVDEVQFLSVENIEQLAKVVDKLGIPVICYGLKTDFQSNLFDASKRLVELADSIEEVKTTCYKCNRKAIMNLRTVDGEPTYEGEQIQVGDMEYFAVCREHYYNFRKDSN